MIYALLVLSGWIIFGQIGLRKTISDKKAIKEFSKKGLLLQTHTMILANRHLHYVCIGQADFPIILFLHGSPQSWTFFKSYLKDKDLLDHYRLVSVDRPGYGKSDFGKVLSMQEQVQQIAALLCKLKNGQPIYIVGHSMAGPLTVALAAKEHRLISKIVILAGALSPHEEKKGNWRKIFIGTPASYLLPGAWRPSNEESYNLNRDLTLLIQDFPKVKCQVYIVHGTADWIISYRNTEWAATKFISAEKVTIITLDNAGHFFLLQKYDRIKMLLQQL